MKKSSGATELTFEVVGQTVGPSSGPIPSPGRKQSPRVKITPKKYANSRGSPTESSSQLVINDDEKDIPSEEEISSNMTTVKNQVTKLDHNVENLKQKVMSLYGYPIY